MTRTVFKNKLLIMMVSCFMLALSCSNAFAWGHRGYYWRGDRWWGPGWFGFDVAVTSLTMGALVEALPGGYTTIVVDGAPYYYYNSIYYRPCPGGYVVVQQPVSTYQVVQSPVVVESAAPSVVEPQAVVTQPVASNVVTADTQEDITVNIPNDRGGYTPVTLKRSGNGFIGPQGEYYAEFPKVSVLKVIYGK